jgi:hypothetical protein
VCRGRDRIRFSAVSVDRIYGEVLGAVRHRHVMPLRRPPWASPLIGAEGHDNYRLGDVMPPGLRGKSASHSW